MASKELNYRLTGTDAGASKAIRGVATGAETSSHRISSAFSKAGSLIGGEFGDILTKVGDGIDSMGEKGKNLGAKFMAGGAALAGVGALLTGVGSKEKEASNQLGAAIKASGGSMSDYKDQIEKAVHTQEGFAHSAVDTKSALTVLTEATNSPTKALSEMSVVTNLAAAKHESLAAAAEQVAKILGGSGLRTLRSYGIVMDSSIKQAGALKSALNKHEAAVKTLATAQQKLTDLETIDAGKTKLSAAQQIALRNAHDAVRVAQGKVTTSTMALSVAQKNSKTTIQNADKALGQLSTKLAGQASASVDSWGGKLRVLKTKIGDTVAEIGQRFGPAVTGVGTALMGAGALAQVWAARTAKASQAVAAAAGTSATEVGAADARIVAANEAAAASAGSLGAAQGSMAARFGPAAALAAAGGFLEAKSFKAATDAGKDHGQAVGNVTKAVNLMIPGFSIATQKIDKFVGSLKHGGVVSGEGSIAMDKVTQAATRQGRAFAAATAADVARLVTLGADTRQAGKLAAAYQHLPRSVRTKVSLDDYASSKIAKVKLALDNLHDKNILLNITTNQIMGSNKRAAGSSGHTAGGSDFFPGGLTTLAEREPEYVVPRGAKVIPESRMHGGGTTVINHFHISTPHVWGGSDLGLARQIIGLLEGGAGAGMKIRIQGAIN